MSTTTSTLNIILNILKKGTGAKDASKELSGVEGAADSAGVGLKGLQAQALAAGGILVGFGAICKQVFEFGAEGAQLQRLADAGTSLAASLSGDMDLIVTKVRAASLGMVSNSDIIAGANRAMMLGIGADADKMASLMEVAAHRARAMGISTTQAFNDIVTGVGRMSPLILDNLGIIIDSKAAYQKYADSIGVAASELTAAQKKQVLLNTVLEEGQAQIAAAGGLAIDAAGNIERLSASTANFTDHLKMAVAGPVADFATGLDMILFGTQHVRDAMNEANMEVRETAGTYEEYSSKLRSNAEVCGLTVDAQGNLIKVIQEGGQYYGQAVEDVTRLEEADYLLSEAAWLAMQANQDQVSAIDGVAMGMGSAATAARDLAGATGESTSAAIDHTEISRASSEALREAGVSAEAAARAEDALALALGTVTPMQLYARDEMIKLAEAYGNGEITAGEYAEAVGEIQNALDTMSPANALDAIGQVNAGLAEIPREIDILINVHGGEGAAAGWGGTSYAQPYALQHGTPYAPGGPTWVGDAGPELVYMPRGARVESAGRSKSIYNQQQYNQGGNTFIINDPMTAAVMMEQAQQQATNNLTGSIM